MNLKTPFAAALLFCACLTPVLAGDVLSPSDIKKLAPGRYAVNVMGLVNMTVSLRSNGVITGEAKGERDRGVWMIAGAKFCVVWNNWASGKRRCATLSGGNGSYQGGGLSLRRI